MTILSAVVADPLYKWNVSPVEARQRQTAKDKDSEARYVVNGDENRDMDGWSSNEDKNKAAEKTIAKINEKLKGYEDSTSGEQQSVEGQVQLLINSARDADNLSTMYPGWSPWT